MAPVHAGDCPQQELGVEVDDRVPVVAATVAGGERRQVHWPGAADSGTSEEGRCVIGASDHGLAVQPASAGPATDVGRVEEIEAQGAIQSASCQGPRGRVERAPGPAPGRARIRPARAHGSRRSMRRRRPATAARFPPHVRYPGQTRRAISPEIPIRLDRPRLPQSAGDRGATPADLAVAAAQGRS